jgi:hypothetical protein
MKGGAVSPVTSYLAIEPGVRPSTDGLDPIEGIGGGGGFGTGRGFGSGHSRLGTGPRSRFDPQAFLEENLGRAWKACRGVGHAEVKLESTRDEVVDVGAPTLAVPSPQSAGCLHEAVWALDLPDSFLDEHHAWTVGVEG